MENIAIEGNDTALQEEEVSSVEQAKPQTLEEIRKARVEKLSPRQEQPEESEPVAQEETTEEAEVEEPQVAETEETTETAEGGEGVLSQIDWDEVDDDSRSEIAIQAMELLPPEKLGELAKKMGSGSGKRIGELTARIKELQRELESKDAALNSSMDTLISPANALAEISSEEELDRIEKETKENIRFYQNWLAGDEDTFDYKGSEYTRSDIVQYIGSLQDKYDDLPKQRKYLNRLNGATLEAQELDSKALDEFSWLADDSSPTHAEYTKMITSSDMAIVSKVAPVLAAKLKYQLAHAATNMVKPVASKKKKIIIPRKVPQNAVSGNISASSQNKMESPKIKKLREAAGKGNLIAARQLRQLQINSRYK
jgi:hypothetical protein